MLVSMAIIAIASHSLSWLWPVWIFGLSRAEPDAMKGVPRFFSGEIFFENFHPNP
jgi:hypothetical protein